MSPLQILVPRGNLRDRIEKLGIEKPHEDLTENQKELKFIALKQNYYNRHPERPTWANGACVYVTPEHAPEIRDAVKEYQEIDIEFELKSKHILVSKCYKDLVMQTLSAPSASCAGARDTYLKDRVSRIQHQLSLPLPTLSPLTLREHRVEARNEVYLTELWRRLFNSDEETRSEASSRDTRTTGDRPREHAEEDLRLAGMARLPPRDADYGRNRKHFRLIKFANSSYDSEKDALEYIDLIVYVQAGSPASEKLWRTDREKWQKLWSLICSENEWLCMLQDRNDPSNEPFPWCTLCKKWADPKHLVSSKCRGHNLQPSPLLEAVLENERMVQSRHSASMAKRNNKMLEPISSGRQKEHQQAASSSRWRQLPSRVCLVLESLASASSCLKMDCLPLTRHSTSTSERNNNSLEPRLVVRQNEHQHRPAQFEIVD